MTFELYADEIDSRAATLPGVRQAEAGAFDNFVSGAGRFAMQGLAKTGRAIDLLGAVGPIIEDKITGGTEAQDRYFKEHDEVFGRAVDYWTPKPGEVGVAGEVVGQLLGTLPQVIASPALAVASAQLSTAEDLVKRGVDADKAQMAGAAQAAGLGLGIWVPILGKTLTQRLLLGGAGFNVAQGVATRGATAAMLEGTPAEGDFKALDPTALTLDVLLGLAFGGLAHVRPEMRAEGEAWAKRLEEWGAKLKPSDVDALVAMRQAQHLGADSMPGRPVDIADQDAHIQRVRQAIDDLAADRPVNVDDLPPPRFEVDTERMAQADEAAKAMRADAEMLAEMEGVKPIGEPRMMAEKPDTAPPVADAEPLAAEASRFARDNADLPIAIGKNADGSDIVTTPAKLLEDADAAMKRTQEDVRLLDVAAACLLGAS